MQLHFPFYIFDLALLISLTLIGLLSIVIMDLMNEYSTINQRFCFCFVRDANEFITLNVLYQFVIAL